MKGKKLLGLNMYAWAGIIALGIVVFIYFRRKNNSATPSPSSNDSVTGGLDESQLASDIAAQTAASLGGTPAPDNGGMLDYGQLQAMLDAQNASIDSALQNIGGLFAGGLGVTNAATNAGGSDGVAVGGAAAAPAVTAPANPQDEPPGTTDVSNPATSFYPPGYLASNPSVPAPAPLYAYSQGIPIAESPIAGSVFSTSTPAAAGYSALGVQPSAPITFVPTPQNPANAAPTRVNPSVGHNVGA